ncbi:hypothetical protein MRB53_033507 [Persea americana]|uniref:Uncharacterized protein n=1 Tax=Persea americana TaxID=3435 RepID=A0ACC2KVX3_PERAE|nr:hypothetical protein MRB53_033507 [Persea americana]
MAYATGENPPSLRPQLRQIEIPLASSDPRVPLFNLSILDRKIDSLRRFLSELLQRNASICDEQIDLVSKEIGSSIHQIILNGAALLGSSQSQNLGSDVGGLSASIAGNASDLMDRRGSSVSSFAEEVNDPIKERASKPSDLCDLTGTSAFLADMEFLRNPEELRIPSAEVKTASDLKFSFGSDSRNLKIPADQGTSAIRDGNLVDLKVLEKSAGSTNLGIRRDGNLFDLELEEMSTMSGNMVDLKLPVFSDSRNLKIPGDQGIPAAGDRNLVDLKLPEESTAFRNGGKDEEDGDDADAEIIELDSEELLAEHMHFCEICGKGFKRDANLRMHKRAHGNQFKTIEALSKPDRSDEDRARKIRFSCPFTGCNRNKSHKRFRPLKSAVCVKNHFKRSHCPKMYSCNRCNKKSFSVVSDLKSHLKHCGECRWRCSCGTSFSRKDKLFGHVALFEGHMPAIVGEDQSKGMDLEEGMQVDREEHVETADAEASDFGFFEGLLEGFSEIDAGWEAFFESRGSQWFLETSTIWSFEVEIAFLVWEPRIEQVLLEENIAL